MIEYKVNEQELYSESYSCEVSTIIHQNATYIVSIGSVYGSNWNVRYSSLKLVKSDIIFHLYGEEWYQKATKITPELLYWRILNHDDISPIAVLKEIEVAIYKKAFENGERSVQEQIKKALDLE